MISTTLNSSNPSLSEIAVIYDIIIHVPYPGKTFLV